MFPVKGSTIKSICEARFGEGIRGCMCTHVRTVTCQCTSPLSPAGRLTSCPRGAKAFGSLSLPTHGKERKSGKYTGLRHLSEQRGRGKREVLRRMREQRGERECSHLLGLESSLLVWAAFNRHVWEKSPGFMKQENTGNSDILGMFDRGSSNREGVGQYMLTVLIFVSCWASWEIGNGASFGGGK